MAYRLRRIRTRSLWREMAIKGARVLRDLEDVLGVVSGLCTLAAFIVALLCLPLLVVLYCVVEASRRACARRLQRLHPGVDVVRETTVRSAMDTKRNQGVVTAVLQVRGRCDLAGIKACLQDKILDKKEADGRLSFPHLRMALTSRSMLLVVNRYVWQPVPDFSLDNHLVLGSNLFRGRPVSELNIQEYVSEVVSKYLAPELPPWQVVVIPCAGQEERYYVVVRLHHLLLSEGSLGLDSLLQTGPAALREDDEGLSGSQPSSPFAYLAPPLVATKTLIRDVTEYVADVWDAFVQAHDPLENLDLLKKRAGLLDMAAAFVVASAAVAKRLLFPGGEDARLASLLDEYGSRRCTPRHLVFAVVSSCRPANVLSSGLRAAWRVGLAVVVEAPLEAAHTLASLCRGGGKAPMARRFALALAAAAEAWRLWTVVYAAPRVLLEDLFFSQREPRHQLQTVSLCGRKVVAWSAPVPLHLVRRVAAVTDATPTEVLVAATAGALREYFRQLGLPAPDTVQCAARYVPQGSATAVGGLLCLPLPAGGGVEAAREAVRAARRRQTALHHLSSCLPEGGLLTRLLPAVLARVLLNHVTRRYAVTLAEVGPRPPCAAAWGHAVEQLMWWRPPQSNICMALTLMQYGQTVRLGVMTDALLSPQHGVIASSFQQKLAELAAAAGVPRDRSPAC